MPRRRRAPTSPPHGSLPPSPAPRPPPADGLESNPTRSNPRRQSLRSREATSSGAGRAPRRIAGASGRIRSPAEARRSPRWIATGVRTPRCRMVLPEAPSPVGAASIGGMVISPEESYSSSTEGEEEEAVDSTNSTPFRPLPFPPAPEPGSSTKAWWDWNGEIRRIREINAKDPAYDLPTVRHPNDVRTTDAVKDPIHKQVLLAAARSIVSISPITHAGPRRPQCTGFIIDRWESGPSEPDTCHQYMIVTSSKVVSMNGTLLDPLPKLSVGLPDKKNFVEADLLYNNQHYDIALLSVKVDFSLEVASIGCCPKYGQEVFVLTRDRDSSLMATNGEILWLEEAGFLGRNYYMFLSCEKLPEGGTGGLVIDHDGKIRGMSFHMSPRPAVLSISTIAKCVDLFKNFSCVACPVLGVGIRTMGMMDIDLLEDIFVEHKISRGFIVDKVSCDMDEDSLGIARGNIILSINGKDDQTLPELEDYLLSLAWDCQSNGRYVSVLNLELVVYDLIQKTTTRVMLPVKYM